MWVSLRGFVCNVRIAVLSSRVDTFLLFLKEFSSLVKAIFCCNYDSKEYSFGLFILLDDSIKDSESYRGLSIGLGIFVGFLSEYS